nr:hypothetical protein [Pseudopedobacter sp.]
MEDKNQNIISKPTADYEKAEMDLLRNAQKHSYTERFLMMTTFMKMDQMFRDAKITHQPDTKSNN